MLRDRHPDFTPVKRPFQMRPYRAIDMARIIRTLRSMVKPGNSGLIGSVRMDNLTIAHIQPTRLPCTFWPSCFAAIRQAVTVG